MIFYVLAIFALVYYYIKRKHSFFKRRNIPQDDYQHPLFGSLKDVFLTSTTHSQSVVNFYNEKKAKGFKHAGRYAFHNPVWIPIDLDVIKRVFTTDFEYFSSHGFYTAESDWMSINLFNIDGQKWKDLRAKLSPTFTSGKMKRMYDILDKLGDRMEAKVEDHCKRKEPIEMKELAARLGTDVASACFFGLEVDSMNDPDNEFRKHGKLMTQPRVLNFMWEMNVNWKILELCNYSFMHPAVNKFFANLAGNSIEYREKNNFSRGDYMDLLIQLKNSGSIDGVSDKDAYSLSFKEVVANIMVMFGAGFETSATTTSFLLFELAKHQDIQDKLRDEIRKICSRNPDSSVKYDDLADMKYADMCIHETLRMYPAITETPRMCTKTYQLPGTDQIIEKGTLVLVPAWGVHKDAEYYPNPDNFNPENFSVENKSKRHEFAFMGFGGGPRLCIGYRFALMQIKISLIKLLAHYRYTLNSKTSAEMDYEKIAITLTAKHPILLDVSKLQ